MFILGHLEKNSTAMKVASNIFIWYTPAKIGIKLYILDENAKPLNISNQLLALILPYFDHHFFVSGNSDW